jgi:D-apionolactonase
MACKVPSTRRNLEVGRVRLCLDGIDLRYVEIDDVEVLRRVFVTLRDADWGTVELSDLDVEVAQADDRITIAGAGHARLGSIEAACTVSIEALASGALEYAVEWSPRASFAYNRMGLCVLHPPEACVGRAYRTSDGDSGHLPTTIGPQPTVDGDPRPLFESFTDLELDVAGLGPARFAFTGDRFEMEDQRNWADGSFKTYCTPLALPRPHAAEPERPIRQTVRVEPPARRSTVRRRRSEVVELVCADAPDGAIPRLGLCWRPGAPPAIGRLGLHHLRVDLRDAETAPDELAAAAASARETGSALVVAAHVPLGDALASHADVISHVLALAEVGDLPANVRRVGGTDDWFVELNRARPDIAGLDGLAWSITPQVHATDELTMVEGLAAQTDQLTTAQAFAPGLPLLVGPITLRPRGAADPRQRSAFAAAWTAGSIVAQAAGGAWSATYFETHGPGGVDASPVLDVLADACRWQGWTRLRSTSSAPLAAQLLAVRRDGSDAREGWLINLRDRPTRVRVDGLGDEASIELDPWTVRGVA